MVHVQEQQQLILCLLKKIIKEEMNYVSSI